MVPLIVGGGWSADHRGITDTIPTIPGNIEQLFAVREKQETFSFNQGKDFCSRYLKGPNSEVYEFQFAIIR